MFTIRVKELFEPIVLWKGDGCWLFLKTFSWETDLWETSDFALKSANFRKEIAN